MAVDASLISPQIPMGARFTPPDIPRAMGAGMDLKQKQIETQNMVREDQDATQDRETIKNYLQTGGDLYSIDGIAKATQDLKGKVSMGTYGKLQEQGQKLKAHDLDTREKISKMTLAELALVPARNEAIFSQALPILDAYAKDKEAGGEQAAAAKYKEHIGGVVQGLAGQKGSDGQPLFPPETLQGIQGMGPEQLAAFAKQTKVYRSVAEAKLSEAKAKEQEALARKNNALADAPPKYKNALLELDAAYSNGDISPENYELYGKLLRDNIKAGIDKKAADAKRAATGSEAGNAIPLAHADLHGGEYLSTLTPGLASSVKAIAEGRTPLSTLSTRGGHREAMLERVTQYDPKFSASDYPTKAAVQKDFTSGVAARNVTAINTAIGHLGSLSELGDALKNKDMQTLNKIVNRIGSELGKPEVNNFDIARGAVGDELMRVFRQVGASENEAESWRKKFDSANSPEKMVGATRTAVDLLESRINALDDQYKRGMNSDVGYPRLLSPKSREVIGKLAPEILKKLDAAPTGANEPEVPKQPAPLAANNPGALMPGGKLAQYKTPEEGIAALDKNLKSYGNQGLDTVSKVISKWAPPNENDTKAYIADVAKRLNVGPDQKIDLNSPYVRHALSGAIMLHESGPKAVMASASAPKGKPQPTDADRMVGKRNPELAAKFKEHFGIDP